MGPGFSRAALTSPEHFPPELTGSLGILNTVLQSLWTHTEENKKQVKWLADCGFPESDLQTLAASPTVQHEGELVTQVSAAALAISPALVTPLPRGP
ncbi:hypothetical protein R6Z07F_002730 [Ovis aries]